MIGLDVNETCFSEASVAREGSFRGAKGSRVEVGVRIWQKLTVGSYFYKTGLPTVS